MSRLNQPAFGRHPGLPKGQDNNNGRPRMTDAQESTRGKGPPGRASKARHMSSVRTLTSRGITAGHVTTMQKSGTDTCNA